jgi:nicotinamide-nucleotide amidase
MLFPRDILQQCRELIAGAQAAGVKITVAESCTGGLLAAAITALEGSSAIFDYGFVTYANAAKEDLLYVRKATLETYGAVSCETAEEMAIGARKHADAHIAVAITGIAGPGGGTPEKPVGLVCFACACGEHGVTRAVRRFGNIGRDEVRLESVRQALAMLLEALDRRAGGPSLLLGG